MNTVNHASTVSSILLRLSFDDEDSIGNKMKFANRMGLAGAGSWAVDYDDFNNGFPLLTKMNDIFESGEQLYPPDEGCVASANFCPVP